MRSFLLSIFISWLALGFTPSYQTAADTWSKRSCSGLFCCNRGPSQPNALKNILPRPKGGTESTGMIFVVEPGDNSITEEESTVKEERVYKYVQSTPYRVGLDKKYSDQIDILGQTTPDGGGPSYDFEACKNQVTYRLPFQVNAHTHMFWEWGKASWFFTKELTGCDMFIAKSQTDQTKALLIHSNLDRLKAPYQQQENLKLKGEMAQAITAQNPGYRLVMRLHAKPTCDNAKDFIEGYKRDHSTPGSKISVYDYDLAVSDVGYIFFGKDGMFYLKAMTGGETKELKATLE